MGSVLDHPRQSDAIRNSRSTCLRRDLRQGDRVSLAGGTLRGQAVRARGAGICGPERRWRRLWRRLGLAAGLGCPAIPNQRLHLPQLAPAARRRVQQPGRGRGGRASAQAVSREPDLLGSLWRPLEGGKTQAPPPTEDPTARRRSEPGRTRRPRANISKSSDGGHCGRQESQPLCSRIARRLGITCRGTAGLPSRRRRRRWW